MLLGAVFLLAFPGPAFTRAHAPALARTAGLAQGTAPAPSVPPAEASKSDTIIACVRGSFLYLAIDIPGFTTEDRNATILRRIFGERGVLVGAIPARLVSVEILAEKDEKGPTADEAWRGLNLDDSGVRWQLFDGAGAACCELSVMMDGSGSHEFHAFFVRGGYRFDLHVSEALTTERQAGFTREAFVRLIESLRFAILRRGTWEEMPESALELMNDAIRRKNGWKEALEKRAEAVPGDPAAWFAIGEISRHFGAPPSEQIPAYRRAIELLDSVLAAKKELPAKDQLALAASEDGLALALLDSGEPEKAIPHLERGLGVAHDLAAPIRAGLTYDLAAAHARLGHEEIAVARLLEADAMKPGLVARAALDKDFDKVRGSKVLQNLWTGDREN